MPAPGRARGERVTRLAGVAVGLAAALVAGQLHVLSFFHYPAGALLDWCFQVRAELQRTPPPQRSPIALVGIRDEDAEKAHWPQRAPIPRAYLAGLVTRLKQAGARVIVLDVLLDLPTREEDDRALEQALRDAGNVLIPAQVSLHGRRCEADRPLPRFERAALAVGSTYVPFDDDLVCRRMPGAVPVRGKLLPSLPLMAAAAAAGQDVRGQDPGLAERLWRARGLRGRPTKPQLINFLGPAGCGVAPAWASDVLDPHVPPEFFQGLRGRVVYVGSYLQDGADHVRTPLSLPPSGAEVPQGQSGVEVLAAAGATWGEAGGFWSLEGWGAGLLVLALSVSVGVLCFQFRLWSALLLCVAAFVGYFAAGVAAFVFCRWELPLISPLVAIGLVAVISVATRFALALRTAEAERAQLAALDQARDEALNTLGHDMLNPINAIRGLVGLLAGEHGAQVPAGEQAEILDRLRSSALRLLRLGEDLRDLRSDRLAEPRLAPVDLVQLVREMVEVHRHRRTPHELTLQAPDTLPLLLDAGQVQRVMENLLENAIRYSPGGGTVTVRVTEEGEAVRVTVRDQGLGIAPEDLGRIFTRYFRATNAREKTRGTGIGLFSVKRLVEAHGGQVGVESAPGQGSMFWFRLPRRPASSQGPPSTWPPGQ